MASKYAGVMRNIGLIPLDAQEARNAFMQMGCTSQTIIARIIPKDFVKVNTVKGTWPFLHALQQLHEAPNDSILATAFEPEPLPKLHHIGIDSLMSMVKNIVSTTIGENIEETCRFAQYHFDSLAAVEVSNSLGRSIGKDLPGTLMYDYPSIEEIARYLHTLLSKDLPISNTKGSQGFMSTYKRDVSMGIPKQSPIRLKLGTRLPGKGSPFVNFSTDNIGIVPYTR